jgi:predicted alpha/beta-hydrolase family hydrolase
VTADHPTEVATPHGPAGIVVDRPMRPRSLLVLGHGAGGDVDAPDLLAVRRAALAASVAVARITQPYRMAGRRAPAPAGQLDEDWLAALATLTRPVRATALSRLPLIVGGRSSGARVACRTARAAGAVGIVALAFPLHPPGRPDQSRADELETGLPTLVVNGDRDPFGVPDGGNGTEICLRPGERHDLRGDPPAVGSAVVDWLVRHGWA